MSSKNAIHSTELYGTSSSGALPTSYGNTWDDQSHRVSYIPPEIPKPSNNDTTTGFYRRSTRITPRSDVDARVSTSPGAGKSSVFFQLNHPRDVDRTAFKRVLRVLRNMSPISQHEAKTLLITTRAQETIADPDPWPNVHLIPPAAIAQGAIVDLSWRNVHRIHPAATVHEAEVIVARDPWANVSRILTAIEFQELNFDQTTWRNISRIYNQEYYQDSQKREILDRLAVIVQREDNWDGYGSQKPTELTVKRAERFINDLLDDDVISAKFLQADPFLCSDEDGYITIECYREKRSLCFDIQEDETQYTKIWRTSANTMTQVDSLDQGNCLLLLEWFLDE